MGRRAREHEIDEAAVEIGEPKRAAAGVEAVAIALKRAVRSMGGYRSGRALLKLNQADGFDCQGCAWPDPDPDHRHKAEFCENGVKAVADEATRDHLDAKFFARHPVTELAEHTDYWLNKQGRITEPYVLRAGTDHYQPIDWDSAFDLMAGHLRAIDPDEVWASADLLLKVKEPVAEEYHRLRRDQVLFTYLHLAASKECTTALLDAGATAVAYETV